MMTLPQRATTGQHSLPVRIVLVRNRGYAMVRQTETQGLDGVNAGTSDKTGLGFPDFAALARAYGLDGQRVEKTQDFAPAFARALGAKRAALIELVIPVEAISTRASLSDLRARAPS